MHAYFIVGIVGTAVLREEVLQQQAGKCIGILKTASPQVLSERTLHLIKHSLPGIGAH